MTQMNDSYFDFTHTSQQDVDHAAADATLDRNDTLADDLQEGCIH